MLKEFTFSNFASYFGTAKFTMQTSNYVKQYKGLNTFETKHGELLKSAFVFGANASGKTNVIKAISFMKSVVLYSFEKENILKNRNVFLFSIDSNEIPSIFEVVFIVSHNDQEITYRYGFEILRDRVSKEWLYKKGKKEVCIFERDDNYQEKIKICYKEYKKAQFVKHYTRGNALFISSAYKFNVDFAEVVYKWFENVQIIKFDTASDYTINLLIENENIYKPLVLEYLKKADFGIEDIVVEKKAMAAKSDIFSFLDIIKGEEVDYNNFSFSILNLKTKHKVFDKQKNLRGEKEISFINYQSHGTVKFLEIIGPFIDALLTKKVLFIDEIDSRLHCSIVNFLVNMFNSIEFNSKNAQLIATTHDVLLMEENLRRDQIWFSQKNEYGESELYRLTDFTGIRKNDLLLKKYLMGQFGAIPFINKE